MGASSIDSGIDIYSKCDLERIEYDNSGRMRYNPYFHARQGMPWTIEELKYLIDFYEFAGAEEISFALERTPASIMQKANDLRRKGLMERKKSCANSSIKNS